MKNLRVGLMCLLCLVMIAGCASSLSGNVYTREQARQAHTVDTGTVILVREVQIEGTDSGFGTIGGAVMGAALGSTIGGGSGRIVATAAGGVGGALAGSAIEEGVTRQKGLEITVELDNGEVLAIVQSTDEQFDEGDRVRVLRRPSGEARVIQ